MQRRREEADGVERDVERDRAAAVERAPPPQVVLRAELHVGAEHGDLDVDDHRQRADRERHEEEVVEVAEPHGGHREVELDEP